MMVLYNKNNESAIPFRGLVPNRLSLMFSDSNSPEKGEAPCRFCPFRQGAFYLALARPKRKAPHPGRLSF